MRGQYLNNGNARKEHDIRAAAVSLAIRPLGPTPNCWPIRAGKMKGSRDWEMKMNDDAVGSVLEWVSYAFSIVSWLQCESANPRLAE